MYDDLISSLRICGRINSANDNCIAFHDGSCEAEPVCMYELMGKAADAIENTSKAYNMMAEAYKAEVTRQWWIPVEERLPETRKVVLITDGIDVGTGWMNQGWWNTSFADIQQDAVTHWMPLPEPPEEE